MFRQALLWMVIGFGVLANLTPAVAAPGLVAVPSLRLQVSTARASRFDLDAVRLMVRMP